MRSRRIYLLFAICMCCLFWGCEEAAPPSGPLSLATAPGPDEEVISMTVSFEGPAKRIRWNSLVPAGSAQMICFSKGDETPVCGDVEEGETEGELFVFQSPLEEDAQAGFTARE